MNKSKIVVILVGIIAACIGLYSKYWMYIPAIINLIKDPIVIVADSIAHNGVSFRAAILTGKFPSKVGYEFTPVSSATARYWGITAQICAGACITPIRRWG